VVGYAGSMVRAIASAHESTGRLVSLVRLERLCSLQSARRVRIATPMPRIRREPGNGKPFWVIDNNMLPMHGWVACSYTSESRSSYHMPD